MPADRFIHPRLGHSDKVSKLSDFEYRVWSQYLLSADDFGVMRASAVTLQADNDALHAKPTKAVQKALDRVIAVELLLTFEHQGRRYVYQRDWQDFQKVDYPRPTIEPKPPETVLATCSDATQALFRIHPGGQRRRTGKPPEHLPESSGNLPGKIREPSPTTRARTRETAMATATASGIPEEGCGEKPRPLVVGKQRPLPEYPRLGVFPFQVQRFVASLGEHVDDFDLDAWLSGLNSDTRLSLPATADERRKWLDQAFDFEMQRRGWFKVPGARTLEDDVAAVRERLKKREAV